MKMEVMAQFLVVGDIIIHERKKYEVTGIGNVRGGQVSFLYKQQKKGSVESIMHVPANQFFNTISKIPLNK